MPAMDFPLALESALKALLGCHSIYSWKITAEGENPTVILRLRQDTEQRACQSGVHVNTAAYKRKPPSQIHRDRRRAEEYHRQRRDQIETVTESKVVCPSENVIEHELSAESIEKESSNNENKKGDSVSVHTSRDNTAIDTEPAARGGEAETTATRDTGGGRASDTDTDTESEMESETECYTETKVSENDGDQLTTDAANQLIKDAKRVRFNQDFFKQEDRNVSFDRVVLDRRGWEAPRLLCSTQDLIVTCNIDTGKTNFELRDPADIHLPFWYFWPDIDQNRSWKETIDGIRMDMNKVLNRIRQLL